MGNAENSELSTTLKATFLGASLGEPFYEPGVSIWFFANLLLGTERNSWLEEVLLSVRRGFSVN